ncbi:uncharacterized protein LOC135481315 [Liolophura sinensis]|uniref:uncharacterized protein LOC135481315 n=1 Tax=Liolophura sinensis TaxID=3198878 RepID=UPI0031590AF3
MKRRKKSGTDTTQSQGQRTLPNHQEMTEVHTNARVYQTLNLSSSSPEIPIYVNSVPSTEYENTFTLTTENDSTDPAYERLQTNPAPIVDTNRLYENTRLT